LVDQRAEYDAADGAPRGGPVGSGPSRAIGPAADRVASDRDRPDAGRRLVAVTGLVLLCGLLLVACGTLPPPSLKTRTFARFEPAAAKKLPAPNDADLAAAWRAWLSSCRAFERTPANRAQWGAVCGAAATVDSSDPSAIRAYFRERFDAWRILAETRVDAGEAAGGEARTLDVSDRGRITGYYEPLLAGSRVPTPDFAVPLYRTPDDLLTVDLSSLFPELAGQRLRGRLVEGPAGALRVVPYWSREELTPERLRGSELLWVDDTIDAFFLQIQGSGRVQLPDGSMLRVGYANTNGHPYRSIGRVLVERGELRLEEASAQGLAAWARAHPQGVTELLNQNPSFVFFRELPLGDAAEGPVGALNVALTPGYSVAVDPDFVPLGAPLLLSTEHPTSAAPLQRLVLAQDTGGAIRGPIRFDFFWGFGRAAGEQAGRMRHDVQAWLLLPKGMSPPARADDVRSGPGRPGPEAGESDRGGPVGE
jgi:membrane-bound lytic murein transglycosylase A